MKVKLFFIMFIALLSIQVMAQDIPNGDFVTWEHHSIPAAFGGGTYARPTDGWDCLNSLAPGSCEKVEGRTTGSTAALLTTKKISVPVSDMGDFYTSVLMLGDFLTAFTEGEPNYGIPFTDQPRKFSFWYKYIPVTGDKGRVHISFWSGDRKDPKARWRKGITFTETVNEWTQVVVDLTEYDEDKNKLDFTPTSMCIEITSSLSSMSDHTHSEDLSNVKQEGSQLYITDLAFEYHVAPAITAVSVTSMVNGEVVVENLPNTSTKVQETTPITALQVQYWQASTEGDVTSLQMDYCLTLDGTTPTSDDWKTLQATKQSDGLWVYDGPSLNLLSGLESNTAYRLEYLFYTNYDETAQSHAYYPTSHQGFVLKFTTGEIPTSIESLQAVESQSTSGVHYNLQGQEVGSDYKGIVIVNGRKIVNK